MSLPLVAVVGRPNVGKSTFVNRIAGSADAIVHEMRGVTRDRSYHEADWNGCHFRLVDTGGIEMNDDDAFQGSIRDQAFAAAEEADVIVLLVDGKTGINADDEEVARILRRSSKPVFLAVNKMDAPGRTDELWEFYQLGLGDPWPISSVHGHGTGDLLDEVVAAFDGLDLSDDEDEGPQAINVAIIGRPNAGKSSCIVFSMAYRLEYCEKLMTDSEYNEALHTAQSPLYFILRNTNPQSADCNKFIWLGIQTFDYRYRQTTEHETISWDAGTNTYIYNIPQRPLWGDIDFHDGKWHRLQADLLPHIRMCLDKMKEKGFFKDTNLSDLEISGMNFGWEVPGTFRAAASIKDLSLRTTAR